MNTKLMIGYVLLFVLLSALLVALFTSKPMAPVLDQEGAIAAVIEQYPELVIYKTASLPPSSIEVKPHNDGWYIGFIQSGSGLPGVLTARCYRVSNTKNIIPIGTYSRQGDRTAERIDLETCMPSFAPTQTPPLVTPSPTSSIPGTPPPTATLPSSTDILPYGSVTLALNQRATFKGLTIRPISVEEDSRCPKDVQCVWAGRVRVKVEVISGMGRSEGILTQGETFTTEVEAITLTGVMPEQNSQMPIANKDYRLTFTVVLR